MKFAPLLVAFAALAAFLPLAHASDVTVTLELAVGSYAAPAYKSCAVAVPAGADAGAVLDAAAASGCISGWSSSEFPGFGRFVTCIDGVCQQQDGLVTFWEFAVDGETVSYGIDAYQAFQGDSVKFAYTNFAVDTVVAPAAGLLP